MGHSQEMSKPSIVIGEGADGFTIVVGDDKRYYFDQEESVRDNMLRLFRDLGYDDVTFEQWF